ncbi:MAG: RNA polymerase sigma-70 factor [Mangrovibacterium sp.]
MDKNRHKREKILMTDHEVRFNELFAAYCQPLCRYAYRLLGDMEEAREVAQDTFTKFWEKGNIGRDETALRSFLYTLARHICIDRIRANRTFKKYRKKILMKYACDYNGLSDKVVSDELDRALEKEIALLPPQCQIVFKLSRFEQLKYKEIAAQLGISVKTVEAHISKGMDILRTKLSDYMLVILLILLFL